MTDPKDPLFDLSAEMDLTEKAICRGLGVLALRDEAWPGIRDTRGETMADELDWTCPVCDAENTDARDDWYTSPVVTCQGCGSEIRMEYDEVYDPDEGDEWPFWTPVPVDLRAAVRFLRDRVHDLEEANRELMGLRDRWLDHYPKAAEALRGLAAKAAEGGEE